MKLPNSFPVESPPRLPGYSEPPRSAALTSPSPNASPSAPSGENAVRLHYTLAAGSQTAGGT